MAVKVTYFPIGEAPRVEGSDEPHYDVARAFIGGYIEVVKVQINGKPAKALMDEEGRMKGLIPNGAFNALLPAGYIRMVGPIILIEGGARSW
jgi:hypothetical protein